jgi:hypothetical protein
MKNFTQKSITVLGLSIVLSIATPPAQAVPAQDNIELVTAILRLPCGILEYDLRDDTSRNAHLTRAALNAIRLLNNLFTRTPQSPWTNCKELVTGIETWHHPLGWFIYDATNIIKELHAYIKYDEGEKPLSTTTSVKNNDYEILQKFILPTIETMCALARTEKLGRSMPRGGRHIASIVLSLTRLGELYYAAPQDSVQRKIIVSLVVACVLEMFVKSMRFYNRAKVVRRHKEERARIHQEQQQQDVGARKNAV